MSESVGKLLRKLKLLLELRLIKLPPPTVSGRASQSPTPPHPHTTRPTWKPAHPLPPTTAYFTQHICMRTDSARLVTEGRVGGRGRGGGTGRGDLRVRYKL
jgi:hypothetical protein